MLSTIVKLSNMSAPLWMMSARSTRSSVVSGTLPLVSLSISLLLVTFLLVCSALRWFFRAARIHRDLSLGNLILVHIKNKDTNEMESVVQLHDWEYSRSFISTAARSTHGFKTVSSGIP
jgi:hypothetical protein